ncbi:MBL fold metallo-hydrolase [bacterium]|nr:MBL fold metallo-hydrolase [bacterium]
MLRIHPIRTGSVRVRRSQRERQPGGMLRILLDSEWTEWLPIYAWAIEHPEGVIVVDTGETARTSAPDYFPRWHPYFRRAVEMNVLPEEEIGPQLQKLGFTAQDIRAVVLTHLHTDHAGGLHHFPKNRILVSDLDYRMARGPLGKVQGYLPQHWPSWFAPEPIHFTSDPLGPFLETSVLTQAGDVVVVRTPGHTPHHISVIVREPERSYFLAGDTGYTQELLQRRIPDGVGASALTAVQTLERILEYADGHPTIYLPSHDPAAEQRLMQHQVVTRLA